jgi:superfamily II DNA or RNA helicase
MAKQYDKIHNDVDKNYLFLEENGRIFPTWVMQNFKKYILPAIIRKEGEDPCNEKIENELTTYQQFVGSYLDYRSPFKDLLVYHGVGSGKTVTLINIYNILYNYTPKWNVFLIIPAALRNDPWLKDMKNWLQKENYEERLKNIVFVHYDSPFADRDFLEKIKKVDSSKPFLFIIDECHRFITNVYNNIASKKGKRAQIIYDYIQQEKKENSNTRILLLSATPGVNNPFEFALIFNLLRPGTFPTSEAIFSQLYISSSNFSSLNEDNKNMFQRRILGLVSYYLGATPDKYASKLTHYKSIIMPEYFEKVYNHFELVEEEKEKIRRSMSRGKIGNDDMSTYSSYTRQACNFVFPIINDKIDGEQRPRPSKFKIKDFDVTILESKDEEKKRTLIKSNKEVNAYIKAIKNYVNSLIEYFKDIHRKDKLNNYTVNDDVKTWKTKYNSSFSNFYSDEKKKSLLFTALYDSSPKMVTIIFNFLKSKGPILLYSNYVEMEGLQILKIYMQFFGFISYDPKNNVNEYFNYVEYHGSIDKDQREINKKIFNDPKNLYGKLAKVILISAAGAEGINLFNVRQVHIMEPYWNEVRIDQVIGRAVRICHHKALPMDERHVDIFRYKMIRQNGKETTDERLESIARRKNNIILSFQEAIREAAVDCELFKNHNMIGSKYKCFQFNEESLLEDQIGPAFNNKIEYDQKINNGLNSKESSIMKIKVRKIAAVYKTSDNTFSKTIFYWYYEKTNVIYDYELNYPIGKIALDENMIPIKIDDITYLIDKIISIPKFKLY